MSLKDKVKTYNFWISLVSAIVLIVRIIGDKFNFIVDTSLIMDITTGLCSIFVILGILSVPKSKQTTENETIKNIDTILSNINSSRELINKMENQLFIVNNKTNQEQTTINENQQQELNTQANIEQAEHNSVTDDQLNTENNHLKETEFLKNDTQTNLENSVLPFEFSNNETIIINDSNIIQETNNPLDNKATEIQENDKSFIDTKPTIESLTYMLECLKNNFETVTKEFDNFLKNNN